jgi:transcription initiation factor TFIID TATA-box-binding protein
MPEIVNIVASGDLGRELDVAAVADDIDADVVNTQGGEYRTPTLYAKQQEGSPLVAVYESGSYHISGAGSVAEAEAARDWFVSALEVLGIGVGDGVTFGVRNVVVVGDLETEMDLNRLTVELGFQHTEYEPEQFPGLVYRPEGSACVFLIFASGAVVIPGAPDAETAFDGFDSLKERLTELAQ